MHESRAVFVYGSHPNYAGHTTEQDVGAGNAALNEALTQHLAFQMRPGVSSHYLKALALLHATAVTARRCTAQVIALSAVSNVTSHFNLLLSDGLSFQVVKRVSCHLEAHYLLHAKACLFQDCPQTDIAAVALYLSLRMHALPDLPSAEQSFAVLGHCLQSAIRQWAGCKPSEPAQRC